MLMHKTPGFRGRCLLLASLLATPLPVAAQNARSDWDVTRARGETHTIDFTTDVGTWMSTDVSADGRWIVFDLLGHVYRVAAAGGAAEALTQESGVAVNFHPQFSPDGSQIAFVSDRAGQNNLWVMGADGSNSRAVFTDLDTRVVEPTWTADGRHIVVRQQGRRGSGIWMYPADGGEGRELLGANQRGAAWPSLSTDGKYLYYHLPSQTGQRDLLKGAYQLRRLELETGRISEVTSGEDQAQYRGSSGSAVAPEVSPDGQWLAFARRIPDGTISYKGQRIGPRTALFVRDLRSGAERMVMDPIELDMAEAIKTLRVLPGYSWSADGRSIVISQGGRVRRLHVESGRVETIPFTARVQRTLSEQARGSHRLSDGPLQVRFARWQTASPDGTRLLFQAVGRIWVMELPDGEPRRLTAASFEPLEYAPAWSPDGRWIAFTSWDDEERSHLWRVPAEGGEPQRLTQEAGEYINPVWAPDGQSLVVTRGSGATARGRTVANNPWYELVSLSASGGEPRVLARASTRHDAGAQAGGRRQIVRASFGPDGRIFYPEEAPPDSQSRGVALVSMQPDGGDRQTHLLLPFADEVVVSPDGRWVAFAEAFNVYLTAMPPAGGAEAPPRIDKRADHPEVRQLTLEGGLYPRWRDANTLEFGSGPRYFRYHVDGRRTDTFQIRLSVPRAIPDGTIAFTGARIITMDARGVIERGTIVTHAGRITCVGDCDTSGADEVVELDGKTIMPGIVDPHAHHHREHSGILPRHNFEAAAYLAFGVTTTMDPIGWSAAVFPEAEMIEAGLMVGPRVFSTGENLAPGDRARTNEIRSYADAEHEINRLADWGAIALKQYGQPHREQRQWIADIGRRRNLMVTGEGSDLPFNLGTTMDGQTGWEHPLSYAPLYEDVARFFGKAEVFYSPTVVVGGASAWSEEFFWQTEELWKDPKQRRWLPWRHLIPSTRRRMLRPETDYSFPMIAQGVADVIEQGGYSAIGSHGQHHGIDAHWEIWMLASAMEPMQALEVATVHGARFLGMLDDLGSLAEGKLADLVVLNSNPLDDIRNTADLQYVIKAGTLYDAATLDELWPNPRPYGGYRWVDPDMLQSNDRPVDYWDRPGAEAPPPKR